MTAPEKPAASMVVSPGHFGAPRAKGMLARRVRFVPACGICGQSTSRKLLVCPVTTLFEKSVVSTLTYCLSSLIREQRQVDGPPPIDAS